MEDVGSMIAAGQQQTFDMADVTEESFASFSSLMICLTAAYVVYYLVFVVKKPVVSCNPRMRKFLSTHCPLLEQNYWPTIWCIEARVQTIFRSLFQSCPHVPYVREMLSLDDGGEIALDWTHNDSSPLPSSARPVVIILPGLTGSSGESYARHMVLESIKLGYRTVVLNYRGNGGSQLKTSRTYCATDTEDIDTVIKCVRRKFPLAPIFATGVSLGGIILTNYLAKNGKNVALCAAMTVSSPWNIFGSCRSLEKGINAVVFNKYLTENLKQSLINYEHLFKDKCDLQHVHQSKTIRDFDERFTAKLFGYKTTEDYYNDACIDRKVHDIKIPLLCLNAADDPFSPGQDIPLDEAARSSHIAIVVTSRGGHIGFFDGCFIPNEISYIQRIFGQFSNAVIGHMSELQSMEEVEQCCDVSDNKAI